MVINSNVMKHTVIKEILNDIIKTCNDLPQEDIENFKTILHEKERLEFNDESYTILLNEEKTSVYLSLAIRNNQIKFCALRSDVYIASNLLLLYSERAIPELFTDEIKQKAIVSLKEKRMFTLPNNTNLFLQKM